MTFTKLALPAALKARAIQRGAIGASGKLRVQQHGAGIKKTTRASCKPKYTLPARGRSNIVDELNQGMESVLVALPSAEMERKAARDRLKSPASPRSQLRLAKKLKSAFEPRSFDMSAEADEDAMDLDEDEFWRDGGHIIIMMNGHQANKSGYYRYGGAFVPNAMDVDAALGGSTGIPINNAASPSYITTPSPFSPSTAITPSSLSSSSGFSIADTNTTITTDAALISAFMRQDDSRTDLLNGSWDDVREDDFPNTERISIATEADLDLEDEDFDSLLQYWVWEAILRDEEVEGLDYQPEMGEDEAWRIAGEYGFLGVDGHSGWESDCSEG